jgi:hypothetical protein
VIVADFAEIACFAIALADNMALEFAIFFETFTPLAMPWFCCSEGDNLNADAPNGVELSEALPKLVLPWAMEAEDRDAEDDFAPSDAVPGVVPPVPVPPLATGGVVLLWLEPHAVIVMARAIITTAVKKNLLKFFIVESSLVFLMNNATTTKNVLSPPLFRLDKTKGIRKSKNA